MECILWITELREKLDVMLKEGCDAVCVSVNDGSDGQPVSVCICGVKDGSPERSVTYFELTDIHSDRL